MLTLFMSGFGLLWYFVGFNMLREAFTGRGRYEGANYILVRIMKGIAASTMIFVSTLLFCGMIFGI